MGFPDSLWSAAGNLKCCPGDLRGFRGCLWDFMGAPESFRNVQEVSELLRGPQVNLRKSQERFRGLSDF